MPAEADWAESIVVMGVSGSGKTTVGKLLAAALGSEFQDADTFHSAENLAKMRSGTPLTDADREPWLARLQLLLHDPAHAEDRLVLACSGLRRSYRDQLRDGPRPLRWIYLRGTAPLLQERLGSRAGHFFDPRLLASQLAALEVPLADEGVREVDIDQPLDQLVAAIIQQLTQTT